MNRFVVALFACMGLVACGGDDDGDANGGGGAPDAGTTLPPAYVLMSGVQSQEGTNSYISILSSLDKQEIDYSKAREIPNWGDAAVHNGKVFVASGDKPTITRYTVDANRNLVDDGGLIDFAAYGVTSTAFWNVIWVSPEKAYMTNGVRDGQAVYVIWNPVTMRITGTMPQPQLEAREGLKVYPGFADRSHVIRDGKLYHPYYWANEDYSRFAPDSRIAVYDLNSDKLITTLSANCAGLDVGTRDEAGNMYFSTWTGRVGLALTRGAEPPCGVKVPAGSESVDEAWTKPWTGLTMGRQGAALRYDAAGTALLSVFHNERIPYDSSTDPFMLVGTENWRIWRVNLSTLQATPIESVDFNSGASLYSRIGDANYVLVPRRELPVHEDLRAQGRQQRGATHHHARLGAASLAGPLRRGRDARLDG